MSAEIPGATTQPDRDDMPPWIDLVLRPEQFFPRAAQRLGGTAMAVLLALLGAQQVIDRMDMAGLRTIAGGGEPSLPETWAIYWGRVLGGALIAAPLSYFLMGGWYWLRLRFSGATAPDGKLSCRIALLATSVTSVPIVALTVVETIRSPTPAATWYGAETFALTALVAPFLSMFVAYRAAISSYDLRRGRALFWFAVLPATVYGAVVLGGALLGAGLIG
ncbi:MAG: hypothetical protein ACQGVC_24505 [Myxococcota bacterium]